MELAWKLIENARLIYEEAEDHPIELANCYETLGEINTEHSNFKEALEDLERCLAILETELDDDDRRIAGVLCSMSVAHQMLDEYEKALKGCTRAAIGVCRARVKRLKSSDEAAVEAVKASLAPGATSPEDPLAAAKAELDQIEAVLGDLTAREEELRGLVSEDNDTRAQIKKAFAAIGGAAVARGILRGRRRGRGGERRVRRAETHDRSDRAGEPRRGREERGRGAGLRRARRRRRIEGNPSASTSRPSSGRIEGTSASTSRPSPRRPPPPARPPRRPPPPSRR